MRQPQPPVIENVPFLEVQTEGTPFRCHFRLTDGQTVVYDLSKQAADVLYHHLHAYLGPKP